VVAVVAVSGCGGVSAGEGDRVVVVNHYEVQETGRAETTEYTEEDVPAMESLSSVDILDLDDGYTIEGFSSYSNGVVLRFYEGRYSYERSDDEGVVRESFSGYFALQNGAIKIYFGDDDGGGYAIETHNGLLEEGYFYDITGVRDDITIASIYRSGAL
jgi:hypothetical protein